MECYKLKTNIILLSILTASCASNSNLEKNNYQIDRYLLPDNEIQIDEHLHELPNTAVANNSGNSELTDIKVTYSENKNYSSEIKKSQFTSFTKEKANITLNFKEIEITELSSIVFNEFLRVPYTISGDVAGKVTIQTASPLKKSQLISTLSNLLKSTGNVLSNESGVYRIEKDDGTFKQKSLLSLPNYKSLVVPLRYITTEQAVNLLEPYSQEIKLSSDKATNTLLLSGDKTILNNILNMLNQFDIDDMKNKSFLIAKLVNSSSDEVKKELETIFKYVNENRINLSFVSIARINSLLVISRKKEEIKSVASWIKKLDVNNLVNKRIFSYKVRNKKASELYEIYSTLSNSNNNKKDETENLKSDHKFTFDDSTNTIHFYMSEIDYNNTLPLLVSLDERPLQVHIEATIIEVSLSGDLKNGIEWFFNSKVSNKYSLESGLDVGASGVNVSVPSFSFGIVSAANGLKALFSTIESNSSLNVISSPSLMVLNNKEASINIGDQVPILESTSSSTIEDNRITNTISYRDTGVILQVTPSINNNKQVTIAISQELTDVSTTTTSGIDAPTFKQRAINTEIIVSDNQTIVLGGLIRNNKSGTERNIPRLKNTRAKDFLKNNTDSLNRTELIVLLTPKIIDNSSSITDLTNEQKLRFQNMRDSFN